MRAAAASAVLVACSLAGLAAQSVQTPVFRSGVEVIEVDVSVVDNAGKPVDTLRAPEFAVSVDGQPRRVVTSEYISDVSAESQLAGVTVDPYVSNNSTFTLVRASAASCASEPASECVPSRMSP